MRTEGRRWIWITTGAFMLWVGVSVAIAQGRGGGQARDNWTDNLPPGNGKDLTAERCSSCHSLERTVQLRKSKDGWEDIVFDMIGRGAPIFVDEANQMCAAGAQVAALIAEKGFEDLDGPVIRVATPDVPIPFSPPLEQAVLPSVERVKEACRDLLAY